MTGKNIFVYKLLKCCEIPQILVYFYVKTATPWKKSPLLFPSNLPLKTKSPLFWKFGQRLNPLPAEREGCTQWAFTRSNRSHWNGNLVTATGKSWQISFENSDLEKFVKLILAIGINRLKSNMNLLESNVWNIL